MKQKINHILNIMMGSFVGVFIGHSIYEYWNFHTHPELYAMRSAPWYTSIMFYGLFTVAFIMVAIAVKSALLGKRRFLKEYIIFLVQLFMFYVFPLFAGPTDTMGMVVLILLATFVLGIILGGISEKKLKFVWPVIVAICFVPSVFIYYNELALIHALWYLVDSTIGLAIGILIHTISKK